MKLKKESLFAWIEYLLFTLNPEKLLSKLDNLEKRILFISGDEDHCFLGDAKKLADKMKSVDIKIIEKCGHVCSIEKYYVFNRMALEFLSFNNKKPICN